MPRFRTSRGDIKEPVRLMFFPWRMSSNFMRCVFPGIIGLSECTWIPVISSIDTVCRLLYGAFALFGTYCFVCGILTHAPTHGATIFPEAILHIYKFQLMRPLMARQEPALVYSSCFSISTHATTHGATCHRFFHVNVRLISTHATTHGATILNKVFLINI